MGDPRKLSKKFKRPRKLWDKNRVLEEGKLKKEFGLKNMKELWMARTELRKVRTEAKKALALSAEERERVAKKILAKLERLNILPGTATIDDILSLNVSHFLERRLQTLVWRKGLAKTPKQARQLVVHGFIGLGGRRVTSPGFMVNKNEENTIAYTKPISLEPQVEEEETKKFVPKEVQKNIEAVSAEPEGTGNAETAPDAEGD